jgi:hypothetical protein
LCQYERKQAFSAFAKAGGLAFLLVVDFVINLLSKFILFYVSYQSLFFLAENWLKLTG